MKLHVQREPLFNALSSIVSVTQRKTSIPSLSNVYLEARNGEIEVFAQDLDYSVRSIVSASVERPGVTTVSGRMLFDVIKELPEGEIHLTLTEGERIEIVTSVSRSKLLGEPASKYPMRRIATPVTPSMMPAKLFHEMVSKTIFATSLDDLRVMLSGVLFQQIDRVDGRAARIVASDGFRIVSIERPQPELSFSPHLRVVLPKRSLSEARRIVEQCDGSIGVSFSDQSCDLFIGRTSVSMQLVEGEYPNVDEATGGNGSPPSLFALVHPSQLLDALRRTSLFTSDRARGVKWAFSDGLLTIEGRSTDLGEAREEVPIEYSGGQVEVGVNARFVIDFIEAADASSRLAIEVGDRRIIKLYPENDPAHYTIIMPMRV